MFSFCLSVLQRNSGVVPRLDQESFIAKFFPLSLCRPNDQRSVVAQRLGKLMNKIGQKERRKEIYIKNIWINSIYSTITTIWIDRGEFCLRNSYLWDVNQLIERWNSPVERIPRHCHSFMICHDTYCWLDDMKTIERNSCISAVLRSEQDSFCRCQVFGVRVCGRQIFLREAVC